MRRMLLVLVVEKGEMVGLERVDLMGECIRVPFSDAANSFHGKHSWCSASRSRSPSWTRTLNGLDLLASRASYVSLVVHASLSKPALDILG